MQLEKSILKKVGKKLDELSFTKDTSTSDIQSKREISDILKENKASSTEITLLQKEIASKDRDFTKVSNEKDKLSKEVLELNDIVLNLKGQLRRVADEKDSMLKQIDTAKVDSDAAFQLRKANAEILRQNELLDTKIIHLQNESAMLRDSLEFTKSLLKA